MNYQVIEHNQQNHHACLMLFSLFKASCGVSTILGQQIPLWNVDYCMSRSGSFLTQGSRKAALFMSRIFQQPTSDELSVFIGRTLHYH